MKQAVEKRVGSKPGRNAADYPNNVGQGEEEPAADFGKDACPYEEQDEEVNQEGHMRL
jgi:hypothetical protein